jgi:hypothetical protein
MSGFFQNSKIGAFATSATVATQVVRFRVHGSGFTVQGSGFTVGYFAPFVLIFTAP